jgi:tRNA dimethylallyltransferase
VIAALDAGGRSDQLRGAQEQTFVGTRRYVRRQRSWFRRDHRVHWLDAAGEADRIAEEALRVWRNVS